jgi:hypothetical protein
MIDYATRVLKGVNAAGGVAQYARAIGVARNTVYGIIRGSNPTKETKAKINGYTRRTGYNPTNTASLPTKRAGISKASAKILFARAKAAGLRPRATVTIRIQDDKNSSDFFASGGRDVYYGNSLKGVDEAYAIAIQSMLDVAEGTYKFAKGEYSIVDEIYSVFW